MEIRRATPADAPILAALEAACFGQPWSAAAVSGDLATAVSRAWIAQNGDGPCGYVLGTLVVDEFTIARIASVPAHRRAGVGRALLHHALACARRDGATAAFLEVRASNVAAIALYTSAGFTVSRRRRAYYADGEDALDMRGELS